jgi:hypothetical protein
VTATATATATLRIAILLAEKYETLQDAGSEEYVASIFRIE